MHEKKYSNYFDICIDFFFLGCSDKSLTYIGNMGYDLSKVNYESVEFNVYHSNTENHKWEHYENIFMLTGEKTFR